MGRAELSEEQGTMRSLNVICRLRAFARKTGALIPERGTVKLIATRTAFLIQSAMIRRPVVLLGPRLAARTHGPAVVARRVPILASGPTTEIVTTLASVKPAPIATTATRLHQKNGSFPSVQLTRVNMHVGLIPLGAFAMEHGSKLTMRFVLAVRAFLMLPMQKHNTIVIWR